MKNRNVGLGPPDQVSSYGINAVFDLMPLGDVPQVGCEGRSLSGAVRGSPVQASAGAYGRGRELFGDVGSGTPRVGGTSASTCPPGSAGLTRPICGSSTPWLRNAIALGQHLLPSGATTLWTTPSSTRSLGKKTRPIPLPTVLPHGAEQTAPLTRGSSSGTRCFQRLGRTRPGTLEARLTRGEPR
jgi:hypothetical protein